MEVCRVSEVHADKVNEVRRKLPADEVLVRVANFFDALGDLTRLKIVLSLLEEELCTCDLSAITGLTPSAISHQLRVLKDRGLVGFRREGKQVFYRLTDEHVVKLLKVALEHVGEQT